MNRKGGQTLQAGSPRFVFRAQYLLHKRATDAPQQSLLLRRHIPEMEQLTHRSRCLSLGDKMMVSRLKVRIDLSSDHPIQLPFGWIVRRVGPERVWPPKPALIVVELERRHALNGQPRLAAHQEKGPQQ